MLAVGVELIGTVVALFYGVAKTQPERPADPQIKGKAEAGSSTGPCDVGRPVRRTVIDHDHVVVGNVGLQSGEDPGKSVGLVVSRDDHRGAHRPTVPLASAGPFGGVRISTRRNLKTRIR